MFKMMNSQSNQGTAYAWLATVAVLLLALYPRTQGPVEYLPGVAMDMVAALSVIWATKYAAENIAEIRAVREAEARPILAMTLLRDQSSKGDEYARAVLHNLGKGAALNVTAWLWEQDEDGFMYRSTPIDFGRFLRANDHPDALLPIAIVAFRSEAQRFIAIEVEYNTVIDAPAHLRWHFETTEHTLHLNEYRGTNVPPFDAKGTEILKQCQRLLVESPSLRGARFEVVANTGEIRLYCPDGYSDERKLSAASRVGDWVACARGAIAHNVKRLDSGEPTANA